MKMGTRLTGHTVNWSHTLQYTVLLKVILPPKKMSQQPYMREYTTKSHKAVRLIMPQNGEGAMPGNTISSARNRLSQYQLRVARYTTIQDLVLKQHQQLNGLEINQALSEQRHPQIELIGWVGYDREQACFVLVNPINSNSVSAINQPDLSKREQQVLSLVACGLSNSQIAKDLVISINTVKAHLHNIFGKLGIQSRTEAALYALRMKGGEESM